MSYKLSDKNYKDEPVVLIVEEQEDIAVSYAKALSKLNAKVLPIKTNSYEVLEILKSEVVDILMMDIMLGGMDGIALLREINALKLQELPTIILVTPLDSEMIINEAARLGAAFAFLRPIDENFLAERVLEVYRDAHESIVIIGGKRYNVKDIRIRITQALNEIGLPSHLLGYRFLHSGLLYIIQKNGFQRDVTTKLYPHIAEEHGSSPQKVERSMRHAIEATWSRGDINSLHRIFGNTVARNSGRPTNSEFLARMTDYVIMNL